MPAYRTATVVEVLAARRGLQRVRLADGARAYTLTDLTGPVDVGDDVVVNTTAVDLGLGTGGWHVVHWNLSRREWRQPGAGHIMKLRYTSLQVDTGAAAEHDPGPVGLPSLGGIPVVVCSLHSQLGVVAAMVAAARPGTRVAYVMTDGAALPLALSDLVDALVTRSLVHVTVTAGHAFGGDLEAVGVPDALALAAARADLVVVAMGPGVVGTGSTLGTTALEVAPVVDAAAALGATPVVAVRASGADARARHQGVSHHTCTALALCRVAPVVAVPAGEAGDRLVETLQGFVAAVDRVDVPDVGTVLDRVGLRVSTMGRGPDDDPLAFAATAAAAARAVQLLGVPGA